MRDVLPQLAVGFAVPISLLLIARVARRAGPLEAASSSGRIALSRPLVIFVLAGGVMFAAFGTFGVGYGLLADDLIVLLMSPFFLVFGAVSLWFAVIARSPGWQVVWDDEGVRGPSTQWSLRRSPPRAIIPWSSITRASVDRSGCRFVETANGTRVVWSQLYGGHDVFEQALADRCPHLRNDMAAMAPTSRRHA